METLSLLNPFVRLVMFVEQDEEENHFNYELVGRRRVDDDKKLVGRENQ